MSLPTGDRVTFLLSDIEGSTRLAQRLDPERWAALLREHDALVDAAVREAGGVVVKHEGDGSFAAFPEPAAAIAAAAAIGRSVGFHPGRKPSDLGLLTLGQRAPEGMIPSSRRAQALIGSPDR